MKIVAAIMDISFVRKLHKGYVITKAKKFLVYDPSKVTRWDYGRKVKDDN